ncbi:MAG: methionyl-tRNA formyltransferase [Ignavibacteriales bacterium]
MSLLDIRKDGDAILREKAKPVKKVNASLRKLIEDMVETMRASRGAGLAAPQVGVSKRIIVVETDEVLHELANPEVVHLEGRASAIEGCLSVAGVIGEVERAAKVRVTGLDRDGRTIWVEGEGLLARALQHEIDHLDGILFTDRAQALYETEPGQGREAKRLRVVFMGTPEFAVPSLISVLRDGHDIAAVVTQPDRPKGRGMEMAPSPVKQAALKHRLPVLQPGSCKSPAFVDRVARLAPDVIVVVAFGQILPRALLDVARLGCINVHASLLPSYRGAAPINWAIMRGESVTGVTTMYMSEKLDAGDIILQKEVPISPEDNAGALHDKLMREGAALIEETLRLVSLGKAPRTAQDEARATYAPLLTLKDEVIDWNRTPEGVRDQIRGMSPWPGAHTVRNGKKIKVLAASVVKDGPRRGRPGEVLEAGETGGFLVKVTGGAVRLDEVQPEGGRRMAAADYLRGARVEPGEILGADT